MRAAQDRQDADALTTFVRAVHLVSQFCGFVAASLVALGVLIVCEMVYVRYALGRNTIWQTDFVTYCLVGATFIGSPYVLMTRGHVNVDVLPHYLSGRKRWWLAVFAALVSLSFSATLAVLTFGLWHEAWENRWLSETVWRARLWIPYASMPIGLGLLSLQCLADLLGLLSGRDPPFGVASTHREG